MCSDFRDRAFLVSILHDTALRSWFVGRMIQRLTKLIFLGVFALVGASEASTLSPCQQTLSKLSDRLWENYHLEPSTSNHEAILQYYKPVALFFAKSFASRAPHRIDIDDLFQEGWMALSNEISRFDPAKGVSFNSFVSQRVRGAMLDFIRRNDPLVRRIRDRDKIVREIKEDLRQKSGSEASDEEVLAELSRSYQSNEAEKIWADHRLATQFVSLDALSKSAQDSSNLRNQTLAESLKDPGSQLPALELEREDSWRLLSSWLRPDAAKVLRYIFVTGIAPAAAASLMKIHPSRVSQLWAEVKEVFQKIGESNIRAILHGDPLPDPSALEAFKSNASEVDSKTRFEEVLEELNDFILENNRWPSVTSVEANEARLGRWVNNNGNRAKIFESLREEVKKVAPKNWRPKRKKE